VKKSIDGLQLTIFPSVYDPAEDSFLLAENIIVRANERVLEVGSGSGYVSLFLAKKFPEAEYFCLDINFQAAKNTLENAKQNALPCHVLNSDLLRPLLRRAGFFDIVLFNAPYLPVEEEGTMERAWAGGSSGFKIINQFLEQLPRILKSANRCFLIYSSLAETSLFKAVLKRLHFKSEIIDQMHFDREKIYLAKITKSISQP